MKKIFNSKMVIFSEIFISSLILVLISNSIMGKIMKLITSNYDNSIYLIIFLNIIITLVLSFTKIITYVINYAIIKLFFIGSNFSERIKKLNFISIMAIGSLIGSFVLFIVFNIIKVSSTEEYLLNNWVIIGDYLTMTFNILALISFGIYVQFKLKSMSRVRTVLCSLLPYTIYNIGMLIIKTVI